MKLSIRGLGGGGRPAGSVSPLPASVLRPDFVTGQAPSRAEHGDVVLDGGLGAGFLPAETKRPEAMSPAPADEHPTPLEAHDALVAVKEVTKSVTVNIGDIADLGPTSSPDAPPPPPVGPGVQQSQPLSDDAPERPSRDAPRRPACSDHCGRPSWPRMKGRCLHCAAAHRRAVTRRRVARHRRQARDHALALLGAELLAQSTDPTGA